VREAEDEVVRSLRRIRRDVRQALDSLTAVRGEFVSLLQDLRPRPLRRFVEIRRPLQLLQRRLVLLPEEEEEREERDKTG